MLNRLSKLIGTSPTTYNGGGGGKSGGQQTMAAAPIQTRASVGNQLDIQTPAFEEETVTEETVDKKKMGTRGLQIPLTSGTSTTAAGSGVQV